MSCFELVQFMERVEEKREAHLQPYPAKLLIVDDDKAILQAANLLLKSQFETIHTTPDPEEIITRLAEEKYDLVLLDMNFKKGNPDGMEGLYWLRQIRELSPDTVIVMFTAYGTTSLAIQAIKEGATDFVLKPWVNEKLQATILSAITLKFARQQVNQLKSELQIVQDDIRRSFGEMIGDSPAMRKVFDVIQKISGTDANVLILGENGTGKELVARSIHTHSTRKDSAFVGVDMGALSESLFESELFGHAKGAFTDAREDRAGRFEIANAGTLFLDEIGNLSFHAQAKLLSALQSRKVTRVGANDEIAVDVRLICATNKGIREMVDQGTFRQDLLYRINTIEIQLPPLRERTGDIPVLINHFLKVYGQKYDKWPLSVSPLAMKRLEEYAWPGNIRELQHTVERCVILSNKSILDVTDFLIPQDKKRNGRELVLDDYNLEKAEKMLILKALEKANGNISKAAAQLGITRASLYRRIEKHGL